MAEPVSVAAKAYRRHHGLKTGCFDLFRIRVTKKNWRFLLYFGGFSVCFCTPCGKTVPGKEGVGTLAGTERHKLFSKRLALLVL